MKVQRQIQDKLIQAFQPTHLEVINESGNHKVPPGSESHFKVILVTEQFQGKPTLARHRQVNQVLAEELSGTIHALSLRVFTPKQWHDAGEQAAASPKCAGAR